MVQRVWLFALMALGPALTDVQGADPSPAAPKVAKLMRNKLEAARTAFQKVWPDGWRDVEVPYRWSLRWLEAERELANKAEDGIAAFQAHLERMRDMERVTKRLLQQRQIPIDQASAAEFYVAEAEVWLARAKE